MCGRYEIAVDLKTIEDYFDEKVPMYKGPNFNVAPTQSVPIATINGLVLMRWGLIPPWANSGKEWKPLINATAENLTIRRTYKPLIPHQRCLIPASGFYEWLKTDNGKTPYLFHLPKRPLFTFAGLYSIYTDPEGHELKSFTIITTTPNEVVEPIHDRMPVILSKGDEQVWLNPDLTEADDVLPILRPYPADEMEKYQVSSAVNSTRNNKPDLIRRVA